MSVDKLRPDRTRVKWERISKLGPGLHEPKRKGDVGWDLECAEEMTIYPGQAVDVPTNIQLELPDGVWAEIRARSSIVRRGLSVEAGTIDTGYRGPLFALVRNMATLPAALIHDALSGYHEYVDPLRTWNEDNAVTILAGERVAQVVFHPVTRVWALEAVAINKATERGEDGFGSTGS